ncbi:unnamed protein product, partial [Hapterophycus canaliculatus]
TLGTCPSLLGPYLRTFNAAMLEARPTYHLLQTYSLISVLLREVPVSRSFSAGEDGGGGGGSAGHALMSTVMPAALNKKELTRGVLSGSSLLQAVTMDLMASILDRSARVAARAAASSSSSSSSLQLSPPPSSPPGIGEMASLLRQRMPEVQTLLGLRDKIGGGEGGGGGVRVVTLKWRLLSLLDRYALVIPASLAAARFDFLKLLPSALLAPPRLAPTAEGKTSSSSGTGSGDGGGGGGGSTGAADTHPLGEAGVWLEALALNPGAVGVLVVLARNACDNAHALMAAGIRAAEKGMKENRFLRAAAGWSGRGSGDPRLEGDWEVEF